MQAMISASSRIVIITGRR